MLSKTEIKALEGVCADDVRDAAMFEIMLQTGLRVGELIELTKEDVVWGDGQDTLSYLIVDGKGKRVRRVPLTLTGTSQLAGGTVAQALAEDPA